MADLKEYKGGRARDDKGVAQEKAERLVAEVNRFTADGKPLVVESSVVTPEGLRVTCKDGETARRLLTFVKLLTPDIMHVLYELHDRVVVLKNPPTWPNALPGLHTNVRPGPKPV